VIRVYSDHAANERTFLAWLRTGVAIVAFGFVIEKFNLFLLVMASAGKPGHWASRDVRADVRPARPL
jgi:putative membrane protein